MSARLSGACHAIVRNVLVSGNTHLCLLDKQLCTILQDTAQHEQPLEFRRAILYNPRHQKIRKEELMIRRNRSLSLTVALVLGMGWSTVFADTLVELKNGDRHSQGFQLASGEFTLEKGQTIGLSQVKQILYGVSGPSSLVTSSGTEGIEEVLRIASEASAFEAKYPDAGGIILLDDMDYRYRPDGTWVLRAHEIYKIKKEDHKALADQALGFTEGRERARLITARCISPTGTVFQANLAEMKITKPQLSPGMFLKYSFASVRIPGVEIGSIVEVVTEIDTYNPYNREFFFPSSYFQNRDPVFQSRMTVFTPQAKPLFWESRNFPTGQDKPAEYQDGEFRKYQWELRDVPPLVEEPLMPKGADSMPYVQAALFEGWDKVYDWINVYWKANTTPSPELASQALDIVKDAKTEDEKVARLYHWIEKNIRYIIIKGDAATLYGSYPAHETVAKQFGCCVDKAMVFSAMLNAVGVKNGPLLINAGSQEMSPRIANLNITHSISRVTRSDGSKYYLDSTGYHSRYPAFGCFDQGRNCLDPFDRSFDLIPMQKPDENQRRVVSTMSLDIGGTIAVHSERFFSGDREAGNRGFLKSMKPSEREKFFQGRVNSFGKGAVLENVELRNLDEVSKEMTIGLEYHISSYPRQIADLAIFQVPGFLEAMEFPEIALASRSYPIEYESTESHFDEGTISIPDGWRIRSLPEPLEIRNEFFAFSGSFKAVGERQIEYRGKFDRLAKRVPLSALSTLKNEVQRVEKFKNDRVFLVLLDSGKQR